ncbi:MAG TPA: YdeI/OmpD-associated family protein [Thermoanaerobaculia bacterium]
METPPLDIRTTSQWRSWLRKNHATSRGVWLLFHKDHTGVTGIPYEESVQQALCFGWIDSLIKRIDEDRYARLFTPRQPTSKWSARNRRRWARLEEQGLLAAPGLAASPKGKAVAKPPDVPVLPASVAKALKRSPEAWRRFRELSPRRRRDFVVWIFLAKRDETRERRIRESIALLIAGKPLGLK